MPDCDCTATHTPRRIVLTGGPGAGKTATIEMIRRTLCRHVCITPESASLVFGGGFPRTGTLAGRQAAQRAIFFVQRELETAMLGEQPAILICDRGTVDSAAYWPGPGDIWSAVGTTREAEWSRYDVVIHLRTPPADGGYNRTNRLRTESAAEAQAIDARILTAWEGHPRRSIVDNAPDFVAKATRVIDLVRAEMPPCCLSRSSSG